MNWKNQTMLRQWWEMQGMDFDYKPMSGDSYVELIVSPATKLYRTPLRYRKKSEGGEGELVSLGVRWVSHFSQNSTKKEIWVHFSFHRRVKKNHYVT